MNIVVRMFIAVSIALGLSACATLPDNCYSDEAHAGLVVFGDSYSDTGHLMVDLPDPFFGARISNGRLAVELLADNLLTKADPSFHPVGCRAGYNYSVVGGNIRGSADEDLFCQVKKYLQRTNGVAEETAVYFVMMGGNDVRQLDVNLTDSERDAELNSILDVLFKELQRLVDAGVMKLMVANGGDMGRLPGSIASGDGAVLSEFSERYNVLFETRMGSTTSVGSFVNINEIAHPGIKIVTFDLFKEMEFILDNPTTFTPAFVNTTDACFETDVELELGVDGVDVVPVFNTSSTPPCSLANIDDFVFFDSVHATHRTHKLIADKIIALAALSF